MRKVGLVLSLKNSEEVFQLKTKDRDALFSWSTCVFLETSVLITYSCVRFWSQPTLQKPSFTCTGFLLSDSHQNWLCHPPHACCNLREITLTLGLTNKRQQTFLEKLGDWHIERSIRQLESRTQAAQNVSLSEPELLLPFVADWENLAVMFQVLGA